MFDKLKVNCRKLFKFFNDWMVVVFEVVLNETKETRYHLWILNWLRKEIFILVKPNGIWKMDFWGWSSEFIQKYICRMQLPTSEKNLFEEESFATQRNVSTFLFSCIGVELGISDESLLGGRNQSYPAFQIPRFRMTSPVIILRPIDSF